MINKKEKNEKIKHSKKCFYFYSFIALARILSKIFMMNNGIIMEMRFKNEVMSIVPIERNDRSCLDCF